MSAVPAATRPAGELIPNALSEAEHLTVDTVNWLRHDSSDALLGIAVAIALYFIFVGIRWGLGRALGKHHPVTTLRGFAARIVRRTRSAFMAVVAADLVTHLVAPPGPLLKAIDIAFTITFAVQGAFWLREVVLALVERRAGADEESLASAMTIIRVLVNVVIWLLAILLILDNLGVNITALVAGLGVGGIAIGLAAQGIFGDLFAALAILFDRPFKVGDTISYGGTTGSVEAIGLKTTRVRALSGEQVIISNTKLLDQQISNMRRIIERRVVVQLGVIYQTPPEQLEAIPGAIEAIIAARPNCRFDRAHFIAFSPSSLDFEIVYHIIVPDLAVMMAERQAIGIAILRYFAASDIQFAYPSQTSFSAGPDGRVLDPRERVPVAGPGSGPVAGPMPGITAGAARAEGSA